MTITTITSQAHFKSILSGSTYVVADFYADWCGPCKAIAPLFSQLATSESKGGRMAFVKIDVDAQKSIAQQYGVTAMPTFLIIKNSTVVNTLRGADPSALRSAVMSASADASKSPAKVSAAFETKGHVLGSDSKPSRAQRASVAKTAQDFLDNVLNGGFLDTIVRFIGLYLLTLFSLDPKKAGHESVFNKANSDKKRR